MASRQKPAGAAARFDCRAALNARNDEDVGALKRYRRKWSWPSMSLLSWRRLYDEEINRLHRPREVNALLADNIARTFEMSIIETRPACDFLYRRACPGRVLLASQYRSHADGRPLEDEPAMRKSWPALFRQGRHTIAQLREKPRSQNSSFSRPKWHAARRARASRRLAPASSR